MMNYIWAGMMLLAFLSAAWQGNMQALSNAVMAGASDAVTLCIKLLGALCLWGGLMEIAKASGLTATVSRMLSPLLRLLFPNFKKDDTAMNAVSMNITANLLGLGNAATPLGLEAMRGLQANNPTPEIASDEMVNFVVLNTAALHLIRTTVALAAGIRRSCADGYYAGGLADFRRRAMRRPGDGVASPGQAEKKGRITLPAF